jgi:hypothetical protein
MLTATIKLTGKTDGDVEMVIGQGNTSGHNKNDTGSFSFVIEGEEEPDTTA